jgi:hypothetical protein
MFLINGLIRKRRLESEATKNKNIDNELEILPCIRVTLSASTNRIKPVIARGY